MRHNIERLSFGAFLVFSFLVIAPFGAKAQLIVDCSGVNTAAYPTIGAALANAPALGATILISGTCTENVSITNMLNLNLGAYWGQTATVIGGVSLNTSESVYIYGLNVTNPAGDGFHITSSRGVILDTCTSNRNETLGLSAGVLSDVTINGPSAFDNNGTGGLNATGGSLLVIADWNGPTEINANNGPGIYVSEAFIGTLGGVTIANNSSPSSPRAAFGVDMFGGARAQIGSCSGSNLFQGNQGGGISLQEGSEISVWDCLSSYQNTIRANGPVGVSAGLGSQVTLYTDVQISGHTGPAVDLYGMSQLYSFGPNVFSQNGAPGDPRTAAIRLDGNSEAFLRGGQISMNRGPAILALVNSSADFETMTFTGNSGGIITCDSSSFMASDLTSSTSNPPSGILCRTPHNLGPRQFWSNHPSVPDWTGLKQKQAQYKKSAMPRTN